MDAILSRLAQLEQQAHLQDSCIAQLNSTVSSLSSQNKAQASTIARLSSEIGTLRNINQDQELVIGELSRAAIPGDHWVWESRKKGGEEGEEGRWVWSLTREEADRSIHPSVHFAPSDFVEEPFVKQWTRLNPLGSSGPGWVLLIEGTKITSPFEACLRRCSPDLPFLRADIMAATLEDFVKWDPIDEQDISKALEEVEIPAGVMVDVRLVLWMKRRRRL